MRGAIGIGIVLALSSSSALAQSAPTALDSTARLASSTVVRVQLTNRSAKWYRGELGRSLPSQCVLVVAPQSEDPEEGLGGYVTPQIERLEIWRGSTSVALGAIARDAADNRQWAPYSLTALRRHEQAEGCSDPSNL